MLIRESILELLADGDLTAASIADELGALRNSVDKALVRAREEREIHVCGYSVRMAAIYRLGPGVDAARPATPDPVAPAEERHDASNVRDVKLRDSQMPVYFELDGGLLPGVRHFACDRYKATLSVNSCADKFRLANSGDAFGRHAHCRVCPVGAQHSGAGPDLNLGTLKGSLTCSRCHRQNGRLIGKRLCISCQNREYEWVKKRNAKGSAPIKHPPLHRLTIGYMAGGVLKTHTVERAADVTEMFVDVLRDSEHAPSFGWLADPATRALRDNPDLDFSISSDEVDEVVSVADLATVADGVQDVPEQAVVPIVATVQADVAVPDADPLQAIRDAVEQLEHDAPLSMPTISRRAAKKLRQRARRQVRVSNVTVQLMRSVGVLPAPVPVVVPVPTSQPFYWANLFAD